MRRMRNSTVVGVFVLFASGSFVATYAWRSQPAQPIPTDPHSDPTQALGAWLHLMPDELERIDSVDPTFAAQSAELESSLETERETLARLFEDAGATDEAISQQVEKVIDIHNQLERRVAEHLLALRPQLTDAQRSRLFQTCADGVRKAGGHRWKHGRAGEAENRRGGRGGPPEGRGQGGRGGRRGPRWNDEAADESTTQPAPKENGDQP